MLISIVMPVYNSKSTLKQSIGSVLNQTSDNWELVCVDDGSTDNSLEILNEYAKSDLRIKIFSKKNSGPGLTRNYAIDRCSGDYIAFLDSDDYWSKNCIEEIIHTANTYNSDIIFLRTLMCYGKTFKDAYNINHYLDLSKQELISCLMSGVLPWGQEKVIRTSIIKNNNLLFSPDPVGEEAIFSFEAMRKSNVISFISEPMYYYCYDMDGQHKLGKLDPWFSIVEKMKKHLQDIKLFDEYESSLNSLALRSLVISSYRICINHSLKDAKQLLNSKYVQYNSLYCLNNYNEISVDKKTKIINWLIKKHLYLPVYLLSKIRNRK